LGLYPNQDENSLLLYGNLVNNTGSPQELDSITGIFYNDQGQVIAGEDSISAYWPFINTIPSAGRVPFELTVENIQSAANFGLSVEARLSSDALLQDFEFLDVSQWNEGSTYCLKGAVQALGDQLEEYLVIAAVLYDGQDKVINFSEYEASDLEETEDNQAPTFEICIAPPLPNQEVTRYELQGWGF
jgi:hypothetical protein